MKLSITEIKPYTPIALKNKKTGNWFFGCFTDEDSSGDLKWEGDDFPAMNEASPKEILGIYDVYRMIMPDEMSKFVKEAIETIYGLVDQQAMTDNWYLPVIEEWKNLYIVKKETMKTEQAAIKNAQKLANKTQKDVVVFPVVDTETGNQAWDFNVADVIPLNGLHYEIVKPAKRTAEAILKQHKIAMPCNDQQEFIDLMTGKRSTPD